MKKIDKKAEQSQNPLESKKRERRHKLAQFADTMHRNFGNPSVVVGICFRNCANRDKKCDDCFKFNEYKELHDKT